MAGAESIIAALVQGIVGMVPTTVVQAQPIADQVEETTTAYEGAMISVWRRLAMCGRKIAEKTGGPIDNRIGARTDKPIDVRIAGRMPAANSVG
jgi:hypothetical protein